jgi:competence protein ComEA
MVRNVWMNGLVALVMMLVGAIAVGPVRAQQAPAADAKVAQVNLNAASAGEIEKLPGVGPAMAARIIEYRQKNGGFKKVEDLMNVKGIAEKTFLKLKPLVTVTPAKTTE